MSLLLKWMKINYRLLRLIILISISWQLFACAANPTNPQDPLEGLNRKVFAFNDALDKAVAKPVSRAYVKYVPELPRHGVTNFFANLAEINSIVNNGLQFKPKETIESIYRFVINSTFGFAGLMDFASALKITKTPATFSDTFRTWGLPSGPYLMLPILGPTTARGATNYAFGYFTNPLNYYFTAKDMAGVMALRGVNVRSNFLYVTDRFEDLAFDRYAALRDVFLRWDAGTLNKTDQYDDSMDWYDEENGNNEEDDYQENDDYDEEDLKLINK